MASENGDYPNSIDVGTNGPESTGDPTEGWDYIKNIRHIVATTFANLTGAVTATHTELNLLSGKTALSEKDQTILSVVIDDISTTDTVYVSCPIAGTVTRFESCLGGPITVADATVTLKDSSDNAMGSLTVANAASAAGDVDTDSTISNNTVSAGDMLKVATDGASTGSVKLFVTILIEA